MATTPKIPSVAAIVAPVVPEVPAETISVELTETIKPAVKEPVLYLADAAPQNGTRPKQFYVSSQWHIVPGTDGNEIEAVNNTTGDRYEGAIADFNDMLRGE